MRGLPEAINRFFALPAVDRRLLALSAALLAAARVGMVFLPLPALHGLLAAAARRAAPAVGGQIAVERIAWAVSLCGRYVPATTCLTRALVTQAVLRQTGRSATLRIGVARDGSGEFKAHAWVESETGVAVGGGGDGTHYVPLPSRGGYFGPAF